MMSEPLRKVLALLTCFSILISPVYGGDHDKKLADIEEERLRSLLAENSKSTEKKKSTNYAGK